MKRCFSVDWEAEQDIARAAEYLEASRPGYGDKLLDATKEVFDLLRQFEAHVIGRRCRPGVLLRREFDVAEAMK